MSKKMQHRLNTWEEKKNKFRDRKESSNKRRRVVALAVVVLVVVIPVAVYEFYGTNAGDTLAEVAPGQDLNIPISEVSDGQAKFYNYTLPGSQKIRFFAIKSSDGVIRAAFDACDVCFRYRRGYHQQGDDMVCNNCGRHFPSVSVNVMAGGCNPAPLTRAVEGDHLVIKASDLEKGTYYF